MAHRQLGTDTAIIIPVYNEATVIDQTIRSIDTEKYFVICVNDGSIDDSSAVIKKTNARLIEHPINMGQGAALQTGVEYALQFEHLKNFVTFDADGQHNMGDVERMLAALREQKFNIILGSRFLGDVVNMPFKKHIILKLAIKFTNSFSKMKLTDTHNGLRVFDRKFAEHLDITMADMAHASEIIEIIGSGKWRYGEVPITITYTDYSMSKGQAMSNSINILFDLILYRMIRRK